MNKDAWKEELRGCFEGLRLLERCKEETILHFNQFREFIAEPAFEKLADGYREYNVRTKTLKLKGQATGFEICFSQSRNGQFQYVIALPKNSVELKLSLKIRGKKSPGAAFEETGLPFMESVPPESILRLPKEDLMTDVIRHYKDFIFKALTSPV